MRTLPILSVVFLILFLFPLAHATDLNYWIEPDTSGNPAKVWVKVPSIPAGGSVTIYARKEVGFSPNGDGVFLAKISNVAAYYSFDVNAMDNSGNGHDGIVNGAEHVDNCIRDGCYYFNGSTWIEIQHSPDFDPATTGDITVLLWAKPNELSGGWRGIYQKGRNAGSYKWYGIWQYNDKVNFVNGDTGNKLVTTLTTDWHYLGIIIQDNSMMWGWVDDTKYGSYSGSKSSETTNISIGRALGVEEYFYGYIDEVLVVKDVLSDDIIRLVRDNKLLGNNGIVFVRKYAPSEPTVTVTDKGSYYEITISNPNSTDLTDFQVSIPASDIGITSTTESIHFSDQPFSGLAVSVSYTPTEQNKLALDPENNITTVEVNYTATVSAIDVNITYWKWTENNTVIQEGNGTPITEITRDYNAVGDYNVCLYAEGTDSTGQTLTAEDCVHVHIDQYPQNLTLTIDNLLTTLDVNTIDAIATDNGTITYTITAAPRYPFYVPPNPSSTLYWSVTQIDSDAQGCINPRMAIYYNGYIYVACWSSTSSQYHNTRIMKFDATTGQKIAYRDVSAGDYEEVTDIQVVQFDDKNYLVVLVDSSGAGAKRISKIDPDTMTEVAYYSYSDNRYPVRIIDVNDGYLYIATWEDDSDDVQFIVIRKSDFAYQRILTYNYGYFNTYGIKEATRMFDNYIAIANQYALAVLRIYPTKVEQVTYKYYNAGGDDITLVWDNSRRILYEIQDYSNTDNIGMQIFSEKLDLITTKTILMPYFTRIVYRNGIFFIIGQDTANRRAHIYVYNPINGDLNELINHYQYYYSSVYAPKNWRDRRFFPVYYDADGYPTVVYWIAAGGSSSYLFLYKLNKPQLGYTYFYPDGGNYTLTVTATDDVGLSKSETVNVKVVAPPTWSIDPFPFHVDEDVTLTVSCDECTIIDANTDDNNATLRTYTDHLVAHFTLPKTRKVTYTVRYSYDNSTEELNYDLYVYANYITLSITVKDEDTGADWNTASVDLTRIEVWDDQDNTFIGKKDNSTTYTISNLTRHHLYRIVLTIQGSGITYTRTYYVKGYEMTVTTYAIPPSDGIYFTHGIKDPAGNPLEGYYHQILKYLNDTWVPLSDIKTSVDGTVSLFIRPATYYTVRVLNQNRKVVKEFLWFADPNVRTVYITVNPSSTSSDISYRTVYDRIQYDLQPHETEIVIDDNSPITPITWKVSDTNAGIKWFSMKVEKKVYSLNPTVVFEQNITDHPSGGEITYTPDGRGVYTVTASVYVDGADKPLTVQKTYVYGGSGTVGTAPKSISSTTLLILGIILSALVVGWAVQYDPLKAGLLGLGVLAVLTIYAPWISVGGIPMWAVFTLTVFAYLFLSWLASRL